MDPERLQQIESLYNEALSLSAAERAAFLDRTCGTDGALRNELESLLACEEQAENYLDKPAFEDMAQSLATEGAGVLVDRMLGRYQLLSLVGRGGMAEVYCAVDTRLNRLVAVKILPEYMAEDQERLHRFEQEARSIAALNHRHICTLHDVGHDGGIHYLVFEYLVGEPLSERLSHGPLPLMEALEHAIQIADALVNAHETGVIHLDLKPENIMVTRTGVKLLDFGIAELRYPDAPAIDDFASEKAVAAGCTVPGTLGYMAPEQAAGQGVDSRADIFAFGAILYQMFTGRSAFTTRTSGDNPPPISEIEPTLPGALNVLVSRCLARHPSERWQSMSDVLSSLQEIRELQKGRFTF
jgi:eukaryotic-like serine/threonine-protein kinase